MCYTLVAETGMMCKCEAYSFKRCILFSEMFCMNVR